MVTCTLCAFISLVWLREQILHGGGPDWLEHDQQNQNNQVSINHLSNLMRLNEINSCGRVA